MNNEEINAIRKRRNEKMNEIHKEKIRQKAIDEYHARKETLQEVIDFTKFQINNLEMSLESRKSQLKSLELELQEMKK